MSRLRHSRKRCPTCKQFIPPTPQPKVCARICCKCKKGIERHHKYILVTHKDFTAFAHRDCDNPFNYVPDKSVTD